MRSKTLGTIFYLILQNVYSYVVDSLHFLYSVKWVFWCSVKQPLFQQSNVGILVVWKLFPIGEYTALFRT